MLKNSRESGDRHARLFWWGGSLLWAALAWWYVFPPAPILVEYCFSRGWYRWMLRVLTPLTQSVRIPIVLVIVPAVVLVFIVSWIRSWWRIRRVREQLHREGFLWGIRRIFLILPLSLIWAIALWGAGYRRVPVENRLHWDTSALSADEMAQLRSFCLEEVRKNLTPLVERAEDRAVRSIASSMTKIVTQWEDSPIRIPERVKLMPKGFLLFNGTSGMCSPLTLEALVDRGLPDTAIVYSAAHELGHVAGFCPEDEASFIGYLSGLQAEDRFARYSCALNIYAILISRLGPNKFKESFEALPELARLDLRRADEAFEKYRFAWLSRFSWRVYNRYLQTQGISEGVRNYSHGIILLAYAWRQGMIKH